MHPLSPLLTGGLIAFLKSLPPHVLAPPRYRRLFTPTLTLYYLILQSLHPALPMQGVLADLHQGGADALSWATRLSQKVRSFCTCAYSKARRRLSLPALRRVLRWQGVQAGPVLDPAWANKQIRLLDGSTVLLRPHCNLPRYFPPHSNQRGKGYWCLMRVGLSFCAQRGLVLDAAAGSKHTSEQALAAHLLRQSTPETIYVADANFGVLSVLQAMVRAKADAVVRLTRARAGKLLNHPPGTREDRHLTWQASPNDQRASKTEPVPGRIICVRLERAGFRALQLCLFTTLLDQTLFPLDKLVELYGQRWRAEGYLRSLKAQLGAGQLDVRSALMAKKQWLSALIAYNLARSLMSATAQAHSVPMASLSFELARQLVCHWIACWALGLEPDRAPQCWTQTLQILAGAKRTNRPKPRPSEPRAMRYLARSFPPLRGSRSAARALLAAKLKC